MIYIALKMLLGDRAKYLGILIGLTFSAMLITEQSAIFTGIMTRTYSFLTDVGQPDIWVVDPAVKYVDDIQPLQDTDVMRVRGTRGVAWAVPLYKGGLSAHLRDGTYQSCTVIGLDDETLIGGPPAMVSGQLSSLREQGGVIVDLAATQGKLSQLRPDGSRRPLAIGDTFELNENRVVVVGICRVTSTFGASPVIYTTYSRATMFAPGQRKLMSFVLVKASPGEKVSALSRRIEGQTGLKAYSAEEFKTLTYTYYLLYTGMPINFLTVVALGFIVGITISGMTFYNFTLDNLRYFGTLKAMGVRNRTLLKMILVQALVVGVIGYGIGIGFTSVWGMLLSGTSQLAFRMPWQLLVASAMAMLAICLGSAAFSLRTVMTLEPAIVFRS